MADDRVWDSLITFYENMSEFATPGPTSPEEFREVRKLEVEACQHMIDLVNRLRVLSDFEDIRPGRFMHLLVLRPEGMETRAFVSYSKPGYFAVSLGDIDNVDIPDSLRWIPEADIIEELKQLLLTLN